MVKRRQLHAWLVEVNALLGGVVLQLLVLASVVDEDPPDLGLLLVAALLCVVGGVAAGVVGRWLVADVVFDAGGLVVSVGVNQFVV